MRLDASDGRIELPASIIETYGDQFELVQREDRLLLLPVSDEPLEALREEFADVDASPEQLREDARRDAVERAGERSWRAVAGIWSDDPGEGPDLESLVEDGRERSRERSDRLADDRD